LNNTNIARHHNREESFRLFRKNEIRDRLPSNEKLPEKTPDTRHRRRLCPTPVPDEAFLPGSRHNPLTQLDSNMAMQCLGFAGGEIGLAGLG
jgi:hypothetical protein